jgi:hypothetical protein
MPVPAIVCAYSPSGYGKSVDCLYSFPTALFLSAAPGGLVAAPALLGIAPNERVVPSIQAATKIIQAERPSAVVLDDFSILAERTHLAIDATGKGGWEAWGKLSRAVLGLREAAIAAGCTLILNAHESPPKSGDSGNFMPGGPKMPSRALSTTLPHVATLVLRGQRDGFIQPPLWGGIYTCDPSDTRWIGKDRYCVVGKKAPMNLREIMHRASEIGHDIAVPARAPGLEWLDEAAEGIAQGLASGNFPSPTEAGRAVTAHYSGSDPRHLRWAWRDGCARYTIRQASAALFDLFTPTSGATGSPAVVS